MGRRYPWDWRTWDDVRDQTLTAPPATPTVPSTFCSSTRRSTMECFNEVAAYLCPVVVQAKYIREGDWLDLRCNRNIEKRHRDISYIFATAEPEPYCRHTVTLHREGKLALAVPATMGLTVWRPIEKCSPPLRRCVAGTRDVCRACHSEPPLCQCLQGRAQTVTEAHITDLERTIRALRDDLALRTGERDSARRALDKSSDRVRRAREALL